MARPVQQFVDYFAAEPVRVSAILRLPLIGLIAVLVWIWEVDHWLPGVPGVNWSRRQCNPTSVTTDPALDMVYAALQETATGLRSTVTELHPQVLARLGLTPAVRELLRQFESRTDLTVYRAARELRTNIGKHAKADGHIGLGSLLAVRRDGRRDGHQLADTSRDPGDRDVAPRAGYFGVRPREMTSR